eukprot:scaffold132708_cov22-Tisochrysis_lutea.AAC.3
MHAAQHSLKCIPHQQASNSSNISSQSASQTACLLRTLLNMFPDHWLTTSDYGVLVRALLPKDALVLLIS